MSDIVKSDIKRSTSRSVAQEDLGIHRKSSYEHKLQVLLLGVLSRAVAIRVGFEATWVFCPNAGEILVRREVAQGLQPAAVVVVINEELALMPQLRAYADRIVVRCIVVRCDGEVVADHRRYSGCGLTIYDP